MTDYGNGQFESTNGTPAITATGSDSPAAEDMVIVATANGGFAVNGMTGNGIGVFGHATTEGVGVVGVSAGAPAGNGLSGFFAGGPLIVSSLDVGGSLTKPGGSFKIDHPLDPANRYLCHSFVESSEMKNIYDGVVTLDSKGERAVELPAWFEALNRDFRYQLTPIGAPAPNLHIAREVSDSHFAIAGGKPGLEVSWQVTGVRKDAWAQANALEVEKEKSLKERGFYLHPRLYGEPEEKSTTWAQYPDIMRRLQNI